MHLKPVLTVLNQRTKPQKWNIGKPKRTQIGTTTEIKPTHPHDERFAKWNWVHTLQIFPSCVAIRFSCIRQWNHFGCKCSDVRLACRPQLG